MELIVPFLSAAISSVSQRAGVPSSLLQDHKDMFWKTKDISHCQLICANMFPQGNLWHVDDTNTGYLQNPTAFALFIIYIAVYTASMLYFNCYFVVSQEPWQLVFTM